MDRDKLIELLQKLPKGSKIGFHYSDSDDYYGKQFERVFDVKCNTKCEGFNEFLGECDEEDKKYICDYYIV